MFWPLCSLLLIHLCQLISWVQRSVWPLIFIQTMVKWLWMLRGIRSEWTPAKPSCPQRLKPTTLLDSAMRPSTPASCKERLQVMKLMTTAPASIQKKRSSTSSCWWWMASGCCSPKLWPSTPSWPSEVWSSNSELHAAPPPAHRRLLAGWGR